MRVWNENEIKDLIQTNDAVLYGALIKLYNCQTEDEQGIGSTRERNGSGFNGIDAPILSSFAEFYKERGYLSPKQRNICRKKLIKYNRQLTRLANLEG